MAFVTRRYQYYTFHTSAIPFTRENVVVGKFDNFFFFLSFDRFSICGFLNVKDYMGLFKSAMFSLGTLMRYGGRVADVCRR